MNQHRNESNIWHYRGRRLEADEWGLWRNLDRPGTFFIHYRPRGRNGPLVRHWVQLGPLISLQKLRDHLRLERSRITARKLGIGVFPEIDALHAVNEFIAHLSPNGRSHIDANRRTVFTMLLQLIASALGENKKAPA